MKEYKRNAPVINRLRRTLLDFLTDENKDKNLTLLRRGKICSKNLHRVKTEKKPRVFKKRIEVEKNTVDLVVAIDCSGSMGGSKIERALDLGYQLNEALNGIEGLNFMMFGYTANEPRVVHYVFRKFGGKLNREMFDRHYMCLGCNNDYESIKWACQKLEAEKGKRKFLFIVSDGYPAMGRISTSALHRETKNIIAVKEKQGIKIVPFFIGGSEEWEHHQKIYTHSVKIGNNDLDMPVVEELINLVKGGERVGIRE